MSYYHEARAVVKAMKAREAENIKKADARAAKECAQEHPLNLLSVEGRSMKLHKNAQLHFSTEKGESLIPWGAQPDVLIDR